MKKRVFRITLITFFVLITLPIFLQDNEYLFKYGTRKQKIAAVNVFMRQKTSRELSLLIESLKNDSEDLYIRQYIIHALRVFDQERAKYALIWALESDSAGLRKEAALAVSKYSITEIMLPLLNALNDRYYKVRKNVLFTLSIIGNRSVIPFVRRSLYDENPAVRNQARITYGVLTNR